MQNPKRWTALFVVVVVTSLFAAACGDDGDDEATTQPGDTVASTTSVPTSDDEPVEGCGEGAVTDPSIIDVEREVARCEPGYPAPQPLSQRETVRVSSSFLLEFNSPLLLADSLGEFDKENLDIEIVNVRFSDALPQLNEGRIDVAVGGLEVALFNAAHQGLAVRAALANYFPPHAGNYDEPQTGLWCRRGSFSTPEEPNLREIEQMRIASSVGKGSSAMYYSVYEIRDQGVENFTIADAKFSNVPSSDTVAALRNDAVDCGILLDPVWLQVADDPAFFLAATQRPGEPQGVYAYGRRLLEERRDIGEAFARAYIRTVNTYFDGDYHEDDEVMAEISAVTNQPVEQLKQIDSLVMDWEFREGTTTRVQELFIDLGVITDYAEAVPEDQVVDRSFYLAAVGAG